MRAYWEMGKILRLELGKIPQKGHPYWEIQKISPNLHWILVFDAYTFVLYTLYYSAFSRKLLEKLTEDAFA